MYIVYSKSNSRDTYTYLPISKIYFPLHEFFCGIDFTKKAINEVKKSTKTNFKFELAKNLYSTSNTAAGKNYILLLDHTRQFNILYYLEYYIHALTL